jgi:hypothetical protein
MQLSRRALPPSMTRCRHYGSAFGDYHCLTDYLSAGRWCRVRRLHMPTNRQRRPTRWKPHRLDRDGGAFCWRPASKAVHRYRADVYPPTYKHECLRCMLRRGFGCSRRAKSTKGVRPGSIASCQAGRESECNSGVLADPSVSSGGLIRLNRALIARRRRSWWSCRSSLLQDNVRSRRTA